MLIVCPTCETAYQLDLATLGIDGRSVRCVRCKTVWHASPEDAQPIPVEAALAQADRSEAAPPPREPAAMLDPAPEETADWSAEAWNEAPQSSQAVAEPVEMTDAPSLVPEMGQDPTSLPDEDHTPAPAAGDIESIAARRARRTARRKRLARSWRPPSLRTAIIVMAAVLVALINWRVAVVRSFPQAASLFAAIHLPVNLRGLDFADVKSSEETDQGVPVLVVDGKIVNVTNQVLEVPRLRLALHNAAGREVYAWTALPTSSVLGPGDSLPFRTRLASPPTDGKAVMVRFFNKRDVVAEFR